MKTVYLVRHAKSSWSDPGLRDIDRPLNKRGKRDAPFMAKLLAGKGVQPDKLISSPANRAFTTAKHFAKAFGLEKDDILVKKAIYEAGPDDIINLVRNLPEEWETVLLFGHNPTYTSVANRFAREMISNVPTCGIVRIDSTADNWRDFDRDNGQVADFYYPKQYFT